MSITKKYKRCEVKISRKDRFFFAKIFFNAEKERRLKYFNKKVGISCCTKTPFFCLFLKSEKKGLTHIPPDHEPVAWLEDVQRAGDGGEAHRTHEHRDLNTTRGYNHPVCRIQVVKMRIRVLTFKQTIIKLLYIQEVVTHFILIAKNSLNTYFQWLHMAYTW